MEGFFALFLSSRKDAGRLMRVPAHTEINLICNGRSALHADLERGDDDLRGALALVAVIGRNDLLRRRALEVHRVALLAVLPTIGFPSAHITMRAVDGDVAQPLNH